MSKLLPETINPWHLCETGQMLKGQMPVAGLSRLIPLLDNPSGIVDVELEFGVGGRNIKYIHGHLNTELNLVCQRCLQAVSFPVMARISLGLVGSLEEADCLEESYEPLITKTRLASLQALIEDELLLALPLVALHQDDKCRKWENATVVEDADHDRMPDSNPFAILATLKHPHY